MRLFNGLDELRAAEGEHLGYSDWITIEQEEIDIFANLTGDRQWIHVDPERAVESPFGSTIAHGFLTLSMLPRLMKQVYRITGLTHGLNYGLNKLRFPSPVPVGSRLRAGVELVSVVDTPAGSMCTMRVVTEREGSDKPVCVAETMTLLVA